MAHPRSQESTRMYLPMWPSLAHSKPKWDRLPSSKARSTQATGHRRICLPSALFLSTWLHLEPYCQSIPRAASACVSDCTKPCMVAKLLPVCGAPAVTLGTPTTAFDVLSVIHACTFSLEALHALPWLSPLTTPASEHQRSARKVLSWIASAVRQVRRCAHC